MFQEKPFGELLSMIAIKFPVEIWKIIKYQYRNKDNPEISRKIYSPVFEFSHAANQCKVIAKV